MGFISVFKYRLVCTRSNTFTSLVILPLAQLGGDHADVMYEIPYVMGWQCGLPQFEHISLCFLVKSFLSQMCDFTPMIFTLPIWGSKVDNSITEIHHTNTAGQVCMRCHICVMLPLLNARVTLLRQAYATAFRRGRLKGACDGSAVWFTAILTHLPVFPFQLIIVLNIRFHAHDFYRADVGL